MAQIIWSPRALTDLESILEHLAQYSPASVRRFGERLLSRVDRLTTHPLLHGYVLEDDTKTYREMIQGNYRVIYRVDSEVVFIVTLHYAPIPLRTNDLPV